MNRQFLSLLKSGSAIIALIHLVSCNVWPQEGSLANTNSLTLNTPSNTSARESITFILGEDKDTKNPYYSEAYKYYANNPSAKTTYLETKCRSLLEVKNYLKGFPPANSKPWGLINLVSHGDQWLGLSVKVSPNLKRSTTERINDFMKTSINIPFSDSVIDSYSEIVIHACGVGNNHELIAAIGKFFSSTNAVPEVTAPLLFEFYTTEINKYNQPANLQYLTQSWMVTYKKNEQPGFTIITNLLHEKYPNSGINWADALTREHPRNGGDTYFYTFDIPVHLSISIKDSDSMPDFGTEEKKVRWINRQPEIIDALQKIEVDTNNFSWSVKTGYSTGKKGKRNASVLVKGYCTVMCILKPLSEKSKGKYITHLPLIPKVKDEKYFYTVNGVKTKQ